MNKISKKPSSDTNHNTKDESVSPFQRIKNIISKNRKIFYWLGGLVIISILSFSAFKVYLEAKEKKRDEFYLIHIIEMNYLIQIIESELLDSDYMTMNYLIIDYSR